MYIYMYIYIYIIIQIYEYMEPCIPGFMFDIIAKTIHRGLST